MGTMSNLSWITSVPVGIPICILGLIGNAISICVWARFIKKQIGSCPSSSIYFIALGIIDSGLLVFFLLTDSIPAIAGESLKQDYYYNWFFSYIGFPFFFFFIVASIWLLIGVTINRLIVVRFPVQARRHCTSRRAKIAIACILFFCFVINFPHFFNFKPECTKTHCHAASTEYAQRGSALKYEFWVHCMILVLVPWASIALINAWIVVTLLRNSKTFETLGGNEEKISERQKQDRQITKVLLTVTFTFLVLLAWQCVNQCFFMLQVSKGEASWILVVQSFDFARLGVVLNSSINCMLYCFSGATFRKELCRLFGRVEESTRTSMTPVNS